MSFELLSVPGVLLGTAILAAGLWLLQRLRVQHREVEVQTTLFWQVALEETRARVFTKRFRHWPAWLLLVAIASLLWMLFAGPQRSSADGTQHIVLLDWSVDDESVRTEDLDAAIELANTLPANNREIIAVGTRLETLLKPNEPIDLARLRAEDMISQTGPQGFDWAIETLSSRASADKAVAAYIVGDAKLEENRLQAATQTGLSVSRVPRKNPLDPQIKLSTFGVSDSIDGSWDSVDLWFDFAGDTPVEVNQIAMSVNQQAVTQPLLKGEDGRFELRNLPADGATLDLAVDGQPIGSMTLPIRNLIKVAFDGEVPTIVRELVELDPACQVVAANADVTIGTGEAANLQLSSIESGAAFGIWSDGDTDPNVAMANIVDQLALRQIDATGLAEKSGEVIGIELQTAETRKIAIWRELFTPAFDFRESRSCPVVVSRAIRWLANKPPIIQWAAVGERLPAQSPQFARAGTGTTASSDGRSIKTTSLSSEVRNPAPVPEAQVAGFSLGFNTLTLLGLLTAVLLTAEWVLYQRGHMP